MIKNTFKILSFFSLFVMSQIGLAKELALNEQDIINLAKKKNESIKISDLEVQEANKKVKQAFSYIFPTLYINAGSQKAFGSGNFVPNAYQWNEYATIEINQPIYTFGKYKSNLNIQKSEQKIEKIDHHITEEDVVLTAKQLYYYTLYAEEIVHISRESYNNALKNKKALKERVSLGRINRNDNLKIQADIFSRKPQLIEAENYLKLSKYDLIDFLSLNENDIITISPQNLNKKISSILKQEKKFLTDLNYNLDLQLSEEEINLVKNEMKHSQSELFPNISAFSTFNGSRYHDDFIKGDTLRDEKSITVGLNLNYEFPLGGSKIHEISIKKIENKIKTLEHQKLKRETKIKFLKFITQLKDLQKKIIAEQTAVSLAQNSYDVYFESFSSGNVTQLQLNDSELLLTQNKLNLALTRLNLRNLASNIERLTAHHSDYKVE